jgi:hypothetical protein
MRRDGVAFAPRVRGYSEKHFVRHGGQAGGGGAAGLPQERPKTMKEN